MSLKFENFGIHEDDYTNMSNSSENDDIIIYYNNKAQIRIDKYPEPLTEDEWWKKELKPKIKSIFKMINVIDDDDINKLVSEETRDIWISSFTSKQVQPDNLKNYEMLEVIGDLNMGESFIYYIRSKIPEADQKELSNLKNNYVSTEVQSELANKLDLGNYVNKLPYINITANILEDLLEAFFGAIIVASERTFGNRYMGKMISDQLIVYLYETKKITIKDAFKSVINDVKELLEEIGLQYVYDLKYYNKRKYNLTTEEHDIYISARKHIIQNNITGKLPVARSDTDVKTIVLAPSKTFEGGYVNIDWDNIRAVNVLMVPKQVEGDQNEILNNIDNYKRKGIDIWNSLAATYNLTPLNENDYVLVKIIGEKGQLNKKGLKKDIFSEALETLNSYKLNSTISKQIKRDMDNDIFDDNRKTFNEFENLIGDHDYQFTQMKTTNNQVAVDLILIKDKKKEIILAVKADDPKEAKKKAIEKYIELMKNNKKKTKKQRK